MIIGATSAGGVSGRRCPIEWVQHNGMCCIDSMGPGLPRHKRRDAPPLHQPRERYLVELPHRTPPFLLVRCDPVEAPGYRLSRSTFLLGCTHYKERGEFKWCLTHKDPSAPGRMPYSLLCSSTSMWRVTLRFICSRFFACFFVSLLPMRGAAG